MSDELHSMMKRIQELSFAKLETELYLDMYPECRSALNYHQKLRDQLEVLVTEFENKYGPITTDGVVGDGWNWVKTIWPWQTDVMRGER